MKPHNDEDDDSIQRVYIRICRDPNTNGAVYDSFAPAEVRAVVMVAVVVVLSKHTAVTSGLPHHWRTPEGHPFCLPYDYYGSNSIDPYCRRYRHSPCQLYRLRQHGTANGLIELA